MEAIIVIGNAIFGYISKGSDVSPFLRFPLNLASFSSPYSRAAKLSRQEFPSQIIYYRIG